MLDQAINEYFLSTELKDCLIELENVDTQPSLADGVLIVVTGFFTMPDTVKHRFTQSFFLAPQVFGGYFVLNDVLRYVREMPSTETIQALVDYPNGNTQIAPFPAEPGIGISSSKLFLRRLLTFQYFIRNNICQGEHGPRASICRGCFC
jgi:hypothetical protein